MFKIVVILSYLQIIFKKFKKYKMHLHKTMNKFIYNFKQKQNFISDHNKHDMISNLSNLKVQLLTFLIQINTHYKQYLDVD